MGRFSLMVFIEPGMVDFRCSIFISSKILSLGLTKTATNSLLFFLTSNNFLRFECTGEAGKVIQWVALVNTVEVTF